MWKKFVCSSFSGALNVSTVSRIIHVLSSMLSQNAVHAAGEEPLPVFVTYLCLVSGVWFPLLPTNDNAGYELSYSCVKWKARLVDPFFEIVTLWMFCAHPRSAAPHSCLTFEVRSVENLQLATRYDSFRYVQHCSVLLHSFVHVLTLQLYCTINYTAGSCQLG